MHKPSILFILIFGLFWGTESRHPPPRGHHPPQFHRRPPPQFFHRRPEHHRPPPPQEHDVDPTCRDKHQHCPFWASTGECRRNPPWMMPNCGFSCHACRPPSDASAEGPFKPNNFLSAAADTENQAPPTDEKCPFGVQVQEVQSRAVPVPAQYREFAQQQGCANPNQPSQCDKNPCYHSRYRSADGSCNNLDDSLMAASYMPLVRLVNANYVDGFTTMIGPQTNHPSPRDLTNFLMRSSRSFSTNASSLITAIGQFLIHDVVRTSLVNTCKCDTRANNCANIPLSRGDQRRTPCIPFTRAFPMCGTGREGNPWLAVNENTPVYGSDPTTANTLREGPFLATSRVNGQLFPPQSGTNIVTGDDRADLFAGMTAFHVVFMRYHNSLVNRLRRINRNWNPDRLYQEARKINGAVMQAIIENEFLPALLGSKISLIGEYTGFKETVNPQVSHEFSAAAARLHGSVQETYPLCDRNFRVVGQYRFVEAVASVKHLFVSGPDLLICGYITTPARKIARLGVSVTELLFGGETDMLSMNVQRGRDFGLRSYKTYRELCGLGSFTFDDWNEVTDPNVRKRVSELYPSPDHVDLYIGGLLENPVDGSILGPTFSCIFAEQMKRTRDGDRFFYKNKGIFTDAQRDSIDQMTLSRVLCEVGGSFTHLPQNVFHVGGESNSVPCSQIPGLDFSLWQD